MNKYKDDRGKVGVLVSPKYGAGWSTWGVDKSFLAMDENLVKMKLENTSEEEVQEYCKKEMGEDVYMGGWKTVRVYWLEENAAFTITEYDGYEELNTGSDLYMIA